MCRLWKFMSSFFLKGVRCTRYCIQAHEFWWWHHVALILVPTIIFYLQIWTQDLAHQGLQFYIQSHKTSIFHFSLRRSSSNTKENVKRPSAASFYSVPLSHLWHCYSSQISWLSRSGNLATLMYFTEIISSVHKCRHFFFSDNGLRKLLKELLKPKPHRWVK
jgi:hypothetical protein